MDPVYELMYYQSLISFSMTHLCLCDTLCTDYSCSDIMLVCKEAAMAPVCELMDDMSSTAGLPGGSLHLHGRRDLATCCQPINRPGLAVRCSDEGAIVQKQQQQQQQEEQEPPLDHAAHCHVRPIGLQDVLAALAKIKPASEDQHRGDSTIAVY